MIQISEHALAEIRARLERPAADPRKPSIQPPVVLVERLRLTRSFQECVTAAHALIQRVETEGIDSLVLLQVYARPGSTEVAVILVFADPEAIPRHIHMLTQWEEFTKFTSTLEPVEIRVHGQLPDDAIPWMQQFNGTGTSFATPVRGFIRV